MRLLVFRHGIAEDVSADGTDASRLLTPQGVERTRKAARGLTAFCDPPDVILTSPKARARQTADAAGEAFGSPIELLEELADGPPGPALSALAERPEETVMIVGHEPMLSELIGILIGGAVELKKGAVARLDVRALTRGGATLRWLLPPKVLRAARR